MCFYAKEIQFNSLAAQVIWTCSVSKIVVCLISRCKMDLDSLYLLGRRTCIYRASAISGWWLF